MQLTSVHMSADALPLFPRELRHHLLADLKEVTVGGSNPVAAKICYLFIYHFKDFK